MPIDPEKVRAIVATIRTQLTDLEGLTVEPPPPPPPPPTGTTFRVKPGDDLQAALDQATFGDTILVTPGGYKGKFVLRKKDGTGVIRVRADVDPGNFTSPKPWVLPEHAPAMFRLESVDGYSPVLVTEAGAHGFSFQGMDVPPVRPDRDQVVLGVGADQTTVESIPFGFEFDQCYFHGDPTPGKGQHRGIAAQVIGLTVRRSCFKDHFEVGRDSQCIAAWNGAGPFVLVDNFLEASGENVMFGGAGISVPDLVPTDILIQGCHFSKNVDWKTHPTPPGVKNLFEIKNGQKVRVVGNLFENCWKHAQMGYCFMITPSNSTGTMPWVRAHDIVIEYNVIRRVGSLLNVNNGQGVGPTQGTKGLTFRQNLAYDINTVNLGDDRMIMLGGGPDQVTIDHNIMLGDDVPQGYLVLYSDPALHQMDALKYTNNVAREGSYGLFTEKTSAGGAVGFMAYSPTGVLQGNVIEQSGVRNWLDHGPGNLKIAKGQLAVQLDSSFRWMPDSPASQHPTTDGQPPGPNITDLLAKMGHLL